MESAIGEFRCLPANVLQADLRPTTLNMNVNTYLISLCASQGRLLLSRSLYRSHVLSTFFGPVLGAMMKQFVGIRGAPRLTEACPRPGLGTRIYIIHVKTE